MFVLIYTLDFKYSHSIAISARRKKKKEYDDLIWINSMKRSANSSCTLCVSPHSLDLICDPQNVEKKINGTFD